MIPVLNRSRGYRRPVAAGGGGGDPGATAAITSGAGSTLRNDYGDYVGFRFTVGAADVYAKSVGRWKVSGNSGSHTVGIFNSGGTLLGSASVNLSGGSAGSYVYATLSGAIHLLAGGTYYCASLESNGGDQWYDQLIASYNAAITVNAAAYHDGSGFHDANSGQTYVPPNFLFDLTP